MLVHHDATTHSGVYDSAACSAFRDLAAAGVAVFAHDAAGFGRSAAPLVARGGLSGHVPSIEALVDDVFRLRASLVAPLEAARKLPVFIVGLGWMGCLAAIHAAARPPEAWAGLVLESPALQTLPPLQRALTAALPAWTPLPGPTLAELTPRQDVAAALRADPFSATPPWLPACLLRAGTVRALDAAARQALVLAPKLASLPLLVFAAADDEPVATFIAATSSADTASITHLPPSGASFLLGPASDVVVSRIATWAAARSPVARGRLRRAAAVAAGVDGKRGGGGGQKRVSLVASSVMRVE